jgi:hypothetical protein
LLYFSAVPEDGLVGLVFDGKPGSGSMADDPDHSNRVLLKSLIGITDRSDDLLLEVFHPADVVYDGEIRNIIEKTIDRDIPSQGILCRRPKTVCPDDLPFFGLDFLKFRSTPKSGYFDDLPSLEENMDQSESSADDPAVSKKGVNLMGVSIGGHIEIFRGFSEEKIPDASTDEISQKSVLMETIEDFQGFFINHFSGNRVLHSWNDELGHFFPFGLTWKNGIIITELV